MAKSKKIVYVADGMNLLHRGFYAMPGLTNSDGLPTGAIRGMMSIILSSIDKCGAQYGAVVFDRPGENFRHRLYPEYKANRDKSDGPNLRPLVGIARRLLIASGIRVFGKRGVEGDDLIASLAVRASAFADRVLIDSNDKDFASLVNNRIHLLKPKGLVLDAKGVFDTYGVHPHQMVDYLMMLGDTVDNIPGVYKVGKKTASKLLAEHGTLKAICSEAKMTAFQKDNFDKARKHFKMTRKLITLQASLMDHLSLNDLRFRAPGDELDRICDQLNFKSTRTTILRVIGRVT